MRLKHAADATLKSDCFVRVFEAFFFFYCQKKSDVMMFWALILGMQVRYVKEKPEAMSGGGCGKDPWLWAQLRCRGAR